jgi:transposase-like protein
MSLEEFCTTDRQKEIVRAYEKAGRNKAKAAKVLGVTRTSVFQAVQTVEKRAAQRGYSPPHDMVHPVPEGFVAKGVSTYYNDDGKPTAQWVKSSLTAEAQLQLMQTIVDEMKADVPKLPKVKAPKKSKDSELLNLYTLTDVHLGMLAWHEEAGPIGIFR